MNAMTQTSLILQVANVQLLESGLAAQSHWTAEGGNIGSESWTTWRLKDAQGRVKPQHCAIVSIDGAFCVRDLCGDTYVNGSHMPLGKDQLAKLEHKDEITVGPYQLRVSFGHADDHERNSGPLDAMFKADQVDLLADEPFDDEELLDDDQPAVNADPLLALDALLEAKDDADALLCDVELKEDSDKPQSLVPEDNLVLHDLKFTPQADSEYEMTSSIRLKKILGFGQRKDDIAQRDIEPEYQPLQQTTAPSLQINTHNVSEGLTMDEKVLDLLEEEVAKSLQPAKAESATSSAGGKHLLTGPMLQGLGIDLSQDTDMERMHFLSQELGESLQACVKGLLELHQQVSEGRFGTMNRNLQPIEDNPLRLGLSYEQTIRTMYDADKSLVHLSAPAAISESLKNVRDHNEAMQHATSEALNQILNAFSPQVLLRRFHHYKRNTDNSTTSDEAWAWNMYCNYYQELTSNRQRGFEKLFWEIFEQAYDKKIREKQLEL
ncbi:type VI secretion system-associated FHA domain protein TagH [Vibrio fluvialis]|uniref:type VI secretion system-associated FHA domain protein TagH n=1 Tax=Vibrio fluvialis TaxID=676 RepID=UPI001C9D4FAF|nr:type VI secretion system-associated FHA domain protein TagH [Vibrio fluvialis]MBY7976962.1 type VI secretion system-associated FHA domain protein TagH [Vibrio fluvialis]